MTRKIFLILLICLVLPVLPSAAQTASPPTLAPVAGGGTIAGTVKDTSGAVIPGAKVALTADNGAQMQARTGNDGAYAFHSVPTGVYSISVTFAGMVQKGGLAVSASPGQVARGDAVMQPAEMKQEVTVAEENTTQLGVQASQNADSLVLKGADLAALPDDPDDLQQDLQALAGPSAGPNGGEIYIDGFSSGRLPPKQSIREIRINQNPFSGEYDKLGFGRIEIFTKPGSDNFHGTASYDISDGVWNARNPFIVTNPVPSFMAQTYGGNVSGPINKRASFFIDVERRQIDDNGILDAYNPITFQPDRGFTPTPQQRTTVSPRIDYQLSTNNTLSARYSYLDLNRDLWGVGQFSLPDNGYSYTQMQHLAQVTETAVINTSVVNETRFQYYHTGTTEDSVSPSPQVLVPGTLDFGGAGYGPCANDLCKGTTQTENNYELQNYTTVTHGKHTIKFGARERDDSLRYYTPSNFNGTFTFASFQAYMDTLEGLGGGATQFTIGAGQPLVSSNMFDLGAYVQDDWRLSQRLTISAGLRWEGQTNIHDWRDAAPRIAFAWAPGRSAKIGSPSLVIRGGVGLFYIRYNNIESLYTSEYNGTNQVSYLVTNPMQYPGFSETAGPGGMPVFNFPSINQIKDLPMVSNSSVQFAAANDLRAPYLIQSALAVEKQLPRHTTLSVNLADTRGVRQFVTRDINAQINGIRPNPSEGDVFQYESSGLLKQLQLITRVNSQLSNRVTLFGAYIWNTAHSNTDGNLCASSFGCGTSTPVNQNDLNQEWSRSSLDIEHRMFLVSTLTAPWKIQLSPFITANSGMPFDITTGGDYLGDGILNARPAFGSAASPVCSPLVPFVPNCAVPTAYGYLIPLPTLGQTLIPRNYGTGPSQFTVNMRLSRTWGFGTTKFAGSSGGAHAGGGGGGPRGGGGFFGGGGPRGGGLTEHRYNLTLSISARNMLNHVNYTPPVGVMGSPFFLQSTGISGGYAAEQTATDNRRLDLQLRFQF